MDLEVTGRHALFFDDDTLAGFVNSPEALVEWNSLFIDRYDVRHLLSSPPPPRNRRRLNRLSPSPEESSLESELDRERFLDLPSASSDNEQGLEYEDEAQEKNTGGYNAVGFSYGDQNKSSEQKNAGAEPSFRPPFSVPEHLLQNLPPTEKAHQIIARTAMFVSKRGAQSEIFLRVKQGDNPTFGFLLPDHNLHPYFRFLVDHHELLMIDGDGEESKAGGLNQMGNEGGALSLLGSVYGSGEDEEGVLEEASALKSNESHHLEGTVNADNARVSHGSVEKKLLSDSVGKDEPLSKPPLASLKEKSHVIKRNRSISTVKSGATTGIKKDIDSTGLISSTVDKLQASVSSTLPKVERPVLEPSSDMKRVVDRIVEFILRNGKELEAVLAQEDTKHGRFPFLLPSSPYHPYYIQALQKAQEPHTAGKRLGHKMEKKSGSKEDDAASLGSDIPYESERKEKFKMVIGKSKKHEKEQPSSAAQSQIGVTVDAAAAAAILQAATRGIKNPSLDILSKTINNIGQEPLSDNQSDRNGKPNASVPESKAIVKTAASEADSSEASLTREQKLKAERLKRAKMFAAMIRSGAAPVKSEPSHGLAVESPESGVSGSDSQLVGPVIRERESSTPMEIDGHDEIEEAGKKQLADERNERRSKRSYRSRIKKGGGEEEEEEGELSEDKDKKHSRKKRRSHRSRDRHKHRKRHSSSQDTESRHRHRNRTVDDEGQQEKDRLSEDGHRQSRHSHKYESSSDDDYRRSRHKHRHDGSLDDEYRRSRHKHRHDGSSDDEYRRSRHKHRHDGSSDDEYRRSKHKHRHDGSSDDEYRRSKRRRSPWHERFSDDEDRHTRHRHRHNSSDDDEQLHSRNSNDDKHRLSKHRCKPGTFDNEVQEQDKSVKRKNISIREKEADLEEGEIDTKSDQSKVSDGGDNASREASVDLLKSSERTETVVEVPSDLRAKIRALVMASHRF